MKHSAITSQDKITEQARLTAVLDKMPDYAEIINLTETFKILGDPTRLRIMLALNRGALCVCELAAVNQLSVSAISHQLRLLRGMKLVKFRKQGKWDYYSLDDHHIESIIQQAQIHVHELSPRSVKEKV